MPVVKMESETVLGDVTNVITNEGELMLDNVSERVSLIRINKVRSKYLGYHDEWCKGRSHICVDSVVCLEGGCCSVLKRLDDLL